MFGIERGEIDLDPKSFVADEKDAVCFRAIAAEQRRFLGCLSNHDAALAVFSKYSLPEYFRSDTPGSAHSCDMYPNRLNP
jgi:hypothetical protein